MSIELRVDHADKRFGGLMAVADVTLTVEPGSLTGLIGPNGAGKSTLFNLLSGVFPPTSGRVVIDDVDVTAESGVAIAQLGIGRTFQTPRGFPSLTVGENVEVMLDDPREGFWRALFAPDRRVGQRQAAVREALDRVGLADRADEPFSNLSGGEQRLLEIARQLVRRPRALLLDEPTAGVHPALQERLRNLLLELNRDGVTVLVVEHNLGFLLALATSIHVMALGRLIASGPPEVIAKDEAVIEAYLGTAVDHAP